MLNFSGSTDIKYAINNNLYTVSSIEKVLGISKSETSSRNKKTDDFMYLGKSGKNRAFPYPETGYKPEKQNWGKKICEINVGNFSEIILMTK